MAADLLYPEEPLVDPEQGLGLAQPWEPPSHWFDEGVEQAPEQALGGMPAPAPLDAPLAPEADWQPAHWYEPEFAGQFQGEPAPQEPAPYAQPQQNEESLFGFEAPAAFQQRAPQEFTPDEAQQGEADAAADRFMAMDPERRAGEMARQDADRERKEATRKYDEITEIDSKRSDAQEVWAKRDAEIATERASIQADLQALSKQGINNDHWWESRSTGQKIASYVTAIIGGLLAPHRGGRNTGIDFIMSAIEQDIQTQQANLQHKRGLLGERRGMVGELAAQNNDALRSADTVRLAALQTLDAKLAAESAKYDPAGTTGRRIAEARATVQVEQAKKAAELEEKMYQRGKDKADFELKLRAERRAGAAQRQASQAHAREEARYQSEHGVVYDDKAGRYNPDPNAPKPTMKLSDQKTALEIEEKVRGSQVHDSRGTLIGVARRGVDGAKEMASDVAGYEEFRTALADINDRIAATQQKYGGLGSDRWKPEDVAAIEALHKPLVFKLARAMNGPGPLSQADVEAAKGSVPTLDTWTTSRKPGAVYDAMVAKADTELNKRLGVQVVGFDESKSPTTRYQSMDRLKEKPGEADTREALLKRAGDPITQLSKADPDIRREAIAGRLGVLDDLRDRKEGLSDEDVADLRGKYAKELAQGDLSKEEHAGLVEYLEVQGGMGQRRRRGREFQESVGNAGLSAPRVGQRR